MVRTTLILEEGCMKAIRELARQNQRQISQVVNELLLEGLQRHQRPQRQKLKLPSYGMGRPRVNLGDRNALEALMDS